MEKHLIILDDLDELRRQERSLNLLTALNMALKIVEDSDIPEKNPIYSEITELKNKVLLFPTRYPYDYTLRVASAIVAEHFGFENRNDWTCLLAKTPGSKYCAWLAD